MQPVVIADAEHGDDVRVMQPRCGSGLQAVVNAAMMVQTGASDVVVAGGAQARPVW